jgi:LacI family transcriptional regulator
MLARRLQLLGHRRIAAVFESPDKPLDQQDRAWSARREGFLSEWRNAGTPDPALVFMEGYRYELESALRRVEDLLQKPRGERPTAVVLPDGGPAGALGTIAAKHGLKVPQALTIAGFDSLHGGSEMTAVRFDAAELGMRAAGYMLARVCANRPAPARAMLQRVKGRYVAGKTHAQAPR